ncbi:hypothetical protein Mgra_00005678 [Meloidogyne graminicola]|uniref:Uncharacterized protein n=1 Tax=Meloidogyne graminicola TaxID=189291 RepID=A0A8S9ZP03_9BILA|nr:hypothetical protein Mgra_00005678 [Meloidogyne graminicola]
MVSVNKQNYTKNCSQNFEDEKSLNATCNILDIGLAREIHLTELQNMQSFIAHKEHEVSVYENAYRLIECQATGERCMVFLADNLFVLRTREQALEILERQINVLKSALKCFYQENASLTEKVALLERLSITNEGLVEIREPDKEGQSSGNIKGKRIEHSPKKSLITSKKGELTSCQKLEETGKTKESVKNYKEDEQVVQKPKGVSEKDYEKFVKLVNSIETSDEDDNSEEEIEDGNVQKLNKVGEEVENFIGNGQSKEDRHVHFSDNLLDELPTGMKKERSILKNKNEHSPIDSAELRRINQKEERRIFSTSKDVVKDEITECENTKNVKNTKATNARNKRQKKERRPISRWKAQRNGLSNENYDDDDDYEHPF